VPTGRHQTVVDEVRPSGVDPGQDGLAVRDGGAHRWHRRLDAAERDTALPIVRANEGAESAAATARQFVDAAGEACERAPDRRPARRPRVQLASVTTGL
jgi:hypothetical protein